MNKEKRAEVRNWLLKSQHDLGEAKIAFRQAEGLMNFIMNLLPEEVKP